MGYCNNVCWSVNIKLMMAPHCTKEGLFPRTILVSLINN